MFQFFVALLKSVVCAVDTDFVGACCAIDIKRLAITNPFSGLIPMVELPPGAESLVNDVLVWIGYGTVVGLLAKAVMPGRDPGGAVATLAMGIAGVIIGCGVWSLIGNGQRVTPISPGGLVAGTLGAFVILLFYRMLGGYWYEDQVAHADQPRRRPRRRRRRYSADF